jgi:hypothetical protein
MTSKKTFDSTSYDSLYREVMGRCLAIQEAICKHDLHFNDTPFKEWTELKNRFWNEYIYPKFENIYFDIFPNERQEKTQSEESNNDYKIKDHNKKMVIALSAWLKRDGFFHMFEGEIFFINITPTDLAFILSDGVPFRRYPPEYVGTLLEAVVVDNANIYKKYKKLTAWAIGLAILVGILLWVIILGYIH